METDFGYFKSQELVDFSSQALGALHYSLPTLGIPMMKELGKFRIGNLLAGRE